MVRPGRPAAQRTAGQNTPGQNAAGQPDPGRPTTAEPTDPATADTSSAADDRPPPGGLKGRVQHWRRRADPLVKRTMAQRPVRAWQHYNARQGNNLAGAVTYFGFLSLFPLIVLAAAITAGLLGPGQVQQVKNAMNRNLPGLADKIDLDPIIANAGAIGVVGAAALLLTGLGWVAATRSALRTTYDLPVKTDNAVVGKIKDAGALVGLGIVMLISVAASTLGSALSSRLLHWVGLGDTTVGTVLLSIGAIVLAVATNFVLFMYLLVGFPRFHIRYREAVTGALIGAIGFELLKAAVSSYISGVAAKSTYGAFGVPIALLLWINFVSRLLLLCAAWTAVSPRFAADHAEDQAAADGEATDTEPTAGPGRTDTNAAVGSTEPAPPRSPDRPDQGATVATRPGSASGFRHTASVARRRLGALVHGTHSGPSRRRSRRSGVGRT